MTASNKAILILVIVSVIYLGFLFVPYRTPASSPVFPQQSFSAQELMLYNGTDPALPTYLAMDGLVYDISAGRDEFYAPGQPYHYLAGTDATAELKLAGGAIIRRKYPVVGLLSD